MVAGQALFNPFGTLGVQAPPEAVRHPATPDGAAVGVLIVVAVAAAALVRLLRWALA